MCKCDALRIAHHTLHGDGDGEGRDTAIVQDALRHADVLPSWMDVLATRLGRAMGA